MRGPDPKLMREFGTEAVYREKLAGGIPLGLRFALGYSSLANSQSERDRQDELHAQAKAMNAQLAYVRHLVMAPVEEGFRHTRAPVILSAGHSPGMMSGSDVPVGMDEGMVRMAQAAGVAIDELEQWEKDAGIGTTILNAGKAVGAAAKAAPRAIGSFLPKFRKGLTNAPLFQAPILDATTGALKSVKNTIGGEFKNTFRALESNNAAADAVKATNAAAQKARTTSLRNVRPELRARFEAKQQAVGLNPTQAPQVAPPPPPLQQTPAQIRSAGKQQAVSMTPEQKAQARIDRRTGGSAGTVQTPQQATSGPAQAPGVKPSAGAPKVEPPSTPAEPTGGQLQGPQPPPAAPAPQAGSVAPTPAASTTPAAATNTAPSGTVTPPAAAPAAAGTVNSLAPAAPAPAAAGAAAIPSPPADPNSWEGKAKAFWAKSGLSSGLGWKIPALAGVGLGAYGLSRAAKGTANLLNNESGPYSYNQGGARAMPGINEWGQPGR